MQGLKILGISALLALSTACQSGFQNQMGPYSPQLRRPVQGLRAPLQNPMRAPLQRFRAPHQFGDLAIKFNNAYHEHYVDNEKAGHRDPQNPDKLFVQLIQRAQQSLDVAIFDIDEPSAVDALIAAAKKGVRVRIMTDSDNLYTRNGELRPHFQALQAAGVAFKGDERSGLMHHKFVIMDGAHVLTGSLNLTPYSLYRDNNNALRVSSPELAQNYQAEFNRMFEQGLLGPNDHAIPFPTVKVDGARIQTFFSPKGGTKQAILNLLSKAQSSIRFMAFSVTDKDIQSVLVKKARAGVHVEGIFDGCMLSQYSIYQDLLTKNIKVHIDGNQALMHSKVFIVDRQVVITGSYNFSMSAEERNNENTLLVHSAKTAKYYEQEFSRLLKAAQNNTPPPYDNRKCSSQVVDDDINPA